MTVEEFETAVILMCGEQVLTSIRRQLRRDSIARYEEVINNHSKMRTTIDRLLWWDETDEGHEYWENIATNVFGQSTAQEIIASHTRDNPFARKVGGI